MFFETKEIVAIDKVDVESLGTIRALEKKYKLQHRCYANPRLHTYEFWFNAEEARTINVPFKMFILEQLLPAGVHIVSIHTLPQTFMVISEV